MEESNDDDDDEKLEFIVELFFGDQHQMSSSSTYQQHEADQYYDIDAILAEEEATPVQFRIEACKLGYLDPGSVDDDMHAGSEVELALWLARVLAQTDMVSLEKNKMKGFDRKFRDDLDADATTVSFARTSYFYTVGVQLAALTRDVQLARLLQKTFAARYKLILENAHNMRGADIADFTPRLSVEERALFAVGQLSFAQLRDWHDGSARRIAPSPLASNNKRLRSK